MDRPSGAHICKMLGGHFRGGHGMCRCPAHQDSSPSLHVTETRSGTVLLKCFAGCDQWSVIRALRDLDLWPDRAEKGDPAAPLAYADRPEHDAEREADEQRRRDTARTMWADASPIYGTAAETYLRHRGVTIPLPPTLRFVHSLSHRPSRRAFPALLGAMQDGAGRVIAVQRTWLKPDGSGKAPIAPAKATLGRMHDAAVRLGRAGSMLGIAEGIETALSAQQIYSVPTWAVLGAGRLAAVTLPEDVRRVVIFADNGEVGLREAAKAAEHYNSRYHVEATVEAPEEAGDWNDALQSSRSRAA